MKMVRSLSFAAVHTGLLLSFLIGFGSAPAEASPQKSRGPGARVFAASGIIREIRPDERMVVIRHGAISNFMDAMTMPFRVKTAKELAGLQPGDEISFQLHVTETESWVDGLVKTGTAPPEISNNNDHQSARTAVASSGHSLLDYKFTNELGQAVSMNDFRGQALAVTFFYTRCPLPDYCPRLSKNFQEAEQKLESMPDAPTNWHFISVSFDPEFDTPQLLQAYGRSYGYDPGHWSFLTGPPGKIGELARACGVEYQPDGGTITHNFRTLIVDASGHLQMTFITGGDLSGAIVSQILKAAAVTNEIVAQARRE